MSRSEVKKHCLAGKIKKQTHYDIGDDDDGCKSFCHVRLFLRRADLRLVKNPKLQNLCSEFIKPKFKCGVYLGKRPQGDTVSNEVFN